MKKVFLVVASIVVIVVVVIAFVLLIGRGSAQQSSTTSKEGLIVRVLESKNADAVKVVSATAQTGDQAFTSYALHYMDNGYIYLVKLKVSNEAKDTYSLFYRLITDKGQHDAGFGCTLGIYSEFMSTDPRLRELFEKAVEVEEGKLYGSDISSLTISPGATLEYYVVFCVPRGETPQKLHVIARTLEGKIVEFDVGLR